MLEKEGVVVYDAFTHKEVLVIAPVLCVICDNPPCIRDYKYTGTKIQKMFAGYAQ